jgi:hypothetical protein
MSEQGESPGEGRSAEIVEGVDGILMIAIYVCLIRIHSLSGTTRFRHLPPRYPKVDGNMSIAPKGNKALKMIGTIQWISPYCPVHPKPNIDTGISSAPNAVGYSLTRGDGSSPPLLSNKGTSVVSINILDSSVSD